MSIAIHTRARYSTGTGALLGLFLAALLLLGGCAPDAAAVPTPTRTPRPTPQPYILATLALDLPAATRAADAGASAAVLVTATATSAPEARLTISGGTANARGGPGTSFPIKGELTQGQALPVTGKNAAGDWWQVCCVAGQKVWVAGRLARVENAGSVAVVAPGPPAANAAPAAPALAVSAPTQVAQPAPVARAAPSAAPRPAAADPCANIGGDGCKWKVTGGPKTADNGGQELKMQLLFIHSGIGGGQPQGSYFVVLEKDGQRLPVPDSVRSVAEVSSQGTLGKFNYEYALTANRLPGNTIDGNYTLWVLDGTGERDSRNVNFTISANQGLLWIQFDQA